jgi:hypothetical protein
MRYDKNSFPYSLLQRAPMKKAFPPYLTDVYSYQERSNTFTIPVIFDCYDDLFKKIDHSPILHKDLTHELTAFLIECAHEIPAGCQLEIIIHIQQEHINPDQENKVITAINNYFSYLVNRESQDMANKKHKAIKYVIFSAAFIAATVLMRSFLPPGMLVSMVSEGLNIGGWVFLWEAFSINIIYMDNANPEIQTAARLCQAPVHFTYEN